MKMVSQLDEKIEKLKSEPADYATWVPGNLEQYYILNGPYMNSLGQIASHSTFISHNCFFKTSQDANKAAEFIQLFMPIFKYGLSSQIPMTQFLGHIIAPPTQMREVLGDQLNKLKEFKF